MNKGTKHATLKTDPVTKTLKNELINIFIIKPHA